MWKEGLGVGGSAMEQFRGKSQRTPVSYPQPDVPVRKRMSLYKPVSVEVQKVCEDISATRKKEKLEQKERSRRKRQKKKNRTKPRRYRW